MVDTFNGDEFTKIEELSKEFPNDQDLGKSVRSIMKSHDFVLGYPNDQDLGKKIRKIVLSK